MRLALVLMGGGARAAYQVGVLKALAEIAREADPLRHTTPFAVVCGSSAGAINATSIASHADDFSHGVRRLLEFWERCAPTTCIAPTGSASRRRARAGSRR
jgi:NTE family protein